MYQQAVGFSPNGLLSGLSSKSPFAKGQAMQAAAGLEMDRQKQNQDFAVKQMKDESENRQQQNRLAAQRASSGSQERMKAADLTAQRNMFDMNMRYDYSQRLKQKDLQLKQALLNNYARDF